MATGVAKDLPVPKAADPRRLALRLRRLARVAGLLVSLSCMDGLAADTRAQGWDDPVAWSDRFAREVDHRLDVPPATRQWYVRKLRDALATAGRDTNAAQSFVLVDRNEHVQAAMVVVRTPAGAWQWLGATAVSTGKVGKYEHFRTPLGVFAHSLDNPDFRSLGTYNENRIRGYGVRGMRVFDFGWQPAERGWGKGGTSLMRLQMHATDPKLLESRLGRVASGGCIRIPATLNVFLDLYGILDADYEAAAARGERLWVLRDGRQTIPWPGRDLVIIDSQARARPPWSPLPGAKVPPSGS